MEALDELRLDAAEVKKLLETVERKRVKNVLSVELRKIESEISFKQEELKKSQNGQDDKPVQPAKPTQSRLPTVDIKTYAWDQSDKFMKIYATVPGVEGVDKEQVTCQFDDRMFSLRCENVKNKNYTCKVINLMEDISSADSYIKIKTDTVLIMLKKKETGKTWTFVKQSDQKVKDTKEKSKKTPAVDATKDPNDSLMDMMKQMYDDGDDEMKRTIAKAWSEGRSKEGGMGGMPGMPSM